MAEYMFFYMRLIFLLGCIGLVSCDPYNGFGCVAPEAHPAVAQARSLSSEQLEIIYVEVQKLSAKYSMESYETQIFEEDFPDSLFFLEADLIRVYRSGGPYIILASCFDERIELKLSPSDHTQRTVTLYWAEPTNKNPYATGNQILWQDVNES